jgi:hypothetical protein
MADQPLTITEERKAAGEQILQLTDDIGFRAVGAGWFYSSEAEIWCYVLVTPMLDSMGPRWLQERLLKVFQRYPLPPGVTPLDLRIVSPREDWYRRFPMKVSSNGTGVVPTMELQATYIPGMTPVDYAYMYRMETQPQFAGDRAKAFDQRVRALLAA